MSSNTIQALPPTRVWEVARTVVSPPSNIVKCLWEVCVWGLWGDVLVVCVCRCRRCCSLSVCVCDLLILLQQHLPENVLPPREKERDILAKGIMSSNAMSRP